MDSADKPRFVVDHLQARNGLQRPDLEGWLQRPLCRATEDLAVLSSTTRGADSTPVLLEDERLSEKHGEAETPVGAGGFQNQGQIPQSDTGSCLILRCAQPYLVREERSGARRGTLATHYTKSYRFPRTSLRLRSPFCGRVVAEVRTPNH